MAQNNNNPEHQANGAANAGVLADTGKSRVIEMTNLFGDDDYEDEFKQEDYGYTMNAYQQNGYGNGQQQQNQSYDLNGHSVGQNGVSGNGLQLTDSHLNGNMGEIYDANGHQQIQNTEGGDQQANISNQQTGRQPGGGQIRRKQIKDFQLPEIYQLDLEALPSKPWREQRDKMSDYFNHGFNEETWKKHQQLVLERSQLDLPKMNEDADLAKIFSESKLWHAVLDFYLPHEYGGLGEYHDQKYSQLNLFLDTMDLPLIKPKTTQNNKNEFNVNIESTGQVQNGASDMHLFPKLVLQEPDTAKSLSDLQEQIKLKKQELDQEKRALEEIKRNKEKAAREERIARQRQHSKSKSKESRRKGDEHSNSKHNHHHSSHHRSDRKSSRSRTKSKDRKKRQNEPETVEKDKEKEKQREREREKDKQKEKDKEREKERERARERELREKEREKEREKLKEKELQREKERELQRQKEKEAAALKELQKKKKSKSPEKIAKRAGSRSKSKESGRRKRSRSDRRKSDNRSRRSNDREKDDKKVKSSANQSESKRSDEATHSSSRKEVSSRDYQRSKDKDRQDKSSRDDSKKHSASTKHHQTSKDERRDDERVKNQNQSSSQQISSQSTSNPDTQRGDREEKKKTQTVIKKEEVKPLSRQQEDKQKRDDRATHNLSISTPGKTIANGKKIEIVRGKDDGSSQIIIKDTNVPNTNQSTIQSLAVVPQSKIEKPKQQQQIDHHLDLTGGLLGDDLDLEDTFDQNDQPNSLQYKETLNYILQLLDQQGFFSPND
ncbi:UNKNOWN [Stylonychia lemnae]|uniref:Pre-mRNA polyadenylation factor Fip1 domain-containing protein n=1 Tax=Stylonychia lemnae TaxID=5949 RepID=A0A077ZZ24_STYLE|nr:UNKNOWN [Stylonychia lemnae]|eukprot:CDW73783.1 UNKNOWN [Stylonychia lemnae]